MAKYIKASDAATVMSDKYHIPLFDLVDDFQSIPAADVQEVRHGKWLNFIGDYSTAECSKCEEEFEVSVGQDACKEYFNAYCQFYKYCPCCGAKMDLTEDVP